MANRLKRPALYLVLALTIAVAIAALSSLVSAQSPEQAAQAAAEAEEAEEEAAPSLRQQSWSQLGADVGNACACRCTHQVVPDIFEWGYFERSLMSGCSWEGKVCVVGGELGHLSRCTPAPAPVRR